MDALSLLLGLPCVGLLALLAVLVPLQIRAERERKDAVRHWAARNGWQVAEQTRQQWTSRLPGRNSNGVGMTLTGPVGGRWVTVAEYYYETTDSDNSTTRHHFVVVVVRLDRPLPPVKVATRGALSQLGRSLFGDKPTATGHPVFDSRFRVIAPDERAAHQLIGPPLIEAHLTGAVPPWSVLGHDLLVHYPGRLRAPETIPAYLAPVLRVAGLLGAGHRPWVTVPPRR
ncbi:hypothetical protein [Nocardia goodfellowii]|uniref:DUF3137 domain-containing protein n=1 Tax=Nocardia goodfellowii TaxID=882446 RepID=A0ABS4QP26_9NOCA|nr:hypothetical protein [Nocardia goodfellowii]MBP2193469.1 hypothetical protein [Nocardia goodfellowii]